MMHAYTKLYFFSVLHFRFLKLYRSQPFATVAVISLLLAAVSLAFFHAREQYAVATLAKELLELGAQEHVKLRRALVPASEDAPHGLPWFQSSDLPSRIQVLAAEAALPLDEVDYSLEADGNQPYMRYRIKMTVVATYPVIRRFVVDATTTLPNLDLDAITCRRNDISAGALSCDLALSAFFRKDAHG